jgi:hypothetical protein
MKKLSMMSAVVASVVFIGCGEVNINISDYPTQVSQPNIVPDVCKSEYDSLKSIPRVAVVKFINNSAFGKANTATSNKNEDYSHAGAAGIAVGANGVGVAEADKSTLNTHTNSVKRVVDPKLDKAIASALEGSLVRMGGAEIYSRSNLNQVMKEQKLQQTGLFDDKTLVKVGKLAGVKYIVTGSIDSVTQEYKDYEKAAKVATSAVNGQQQQESLQSMAFKAVLNLGASALSGMKITTRATIKIIDVSTGKIVFSKQIEETKNIGKIKNPTYTQVIGGIKDGLMEGIKGVKPELSKFFAPTGYILQVKADKDHKNFIAQINLGSIKKIKPSQTFQVYKFDEVTDPVTNKTTCSKYAMNVKLKVSKNQIQPDRSWTKADGDDAPKLRAGQIVKRDALENSLF